MGYSWIDAHLLVVGSPGVGWPVAWKRFVLIMIGMQSAYNVLAVITSLLQVSQRPSLLWCFHLLPAVKRYASEMLLQSWAYRKRTAFSSQPGLASKRRRVQHLWPGCRSSVKNWFRCPIRPSQWSKWPSWQSGKAVSVANGLLRNTTSSLTLNMRWSAVLHR